MGAGEDLGVRLLSLPAALLVRAGSVPVSRVLSGLRQQLSTVCLFGV